MKTIAPEKWGNFIIQNIKGEYNMSIRINNEQIVEKMRSLPTKTRQDVVSELVKDESLTDNHIDIVMEIFAGRKKEMEEKAQLKVTPKVYEDIVSSVAGFDPMLRQDIAKLIIDDPGYNDEDYQFFMKQTSSPEANASRKNKM